MQQVSRRFYFNDYCYITMDLERYINMDLDRMDCQKNDRPMTGPVLSFLGTRDYVRDRRKLRRLVFDLWICSFLRILAR